MQNLAEDSQIIQVARWSFRCLSVRLGEVLSSRRRPFLLPLRIPFRTAFRAPLLRDGMGSDALPGIPGVLTLSGEVLGRI